MMGRCHFVYAGDVDDGRIQSPHSITKNLYYYLKKRTEVVYYQWHDAVDIDFKPDDILIGHPHYDTNTAVQRAFRGEKKCKLRCLIHPFHHRRTEDNWPFDQLARKADAIFSICGPYWYDTIEQTKFAHWKPKITRLDMAIDPNQFPYLRTAFHDPGKRKLVYIGSSTVNKNLGWLTQLMQLYLGHATLHWYGGSSDHPLARLPNVRTLGWSQLEGDLAKSIVDTCDIFVNSSISDANPTTLLEAQAWGIITCCTPESGYYNDPHFTQLDLNDMHGSAVKINNLLYDVPSSVLLERALSARAKVVDHYSWNRFCGTIWSQVLKLTGQS